MTYTGQAGGSLDWPHLSAQPPAVSLGNSACEVNKPGRSTAVISKQTDGNSSSAVRSNGMDNTFETAINTMSAHTAASATSTDWAVLSSTPCHTQNRFSVLAGDDSNDGDNDGDKDADDRPFITVSRQGNKRMRPGTTPQQHSTAAAAAAAATTRPTVRCVSYQLSCYW